MSFLEGEVDLADSRWSNLDLQNAREYWLKVRRILGPDAAIGNPMQELLNANTLPSINTCIHVVSCISMTASATDSRDESTVSTKVKLLLAERNNAQFMDRLFEFEVGSWLSSQFGQIRMEPPVGDGRTVDFSIEIDDTVVYIECTRLQISNLTTALTARSEIAAAVGRAAEKEGLLREVKIEIPIGIKPSDIPSFTQRNVLARMSQQPEGTLEVPTSLGEAATISWRPIQQHDTAEAGLATDATVFLVGNGVSFGFSSAVHTELKENSLRENVTKAVKNRMKDKKAQYSLSEPYVLMLGLGHEIGYSDRLWPAATESAITLLRNQAHAWISAIVAVTPPMSFSSTAPNGTIALLSSEHEAKRPVPQGFLAPFEG